MLSLFPSLLSWSELSPFLIRLTLGGVLLYWAYARYRKSAWDMVANLDGIIGILLLIGLWTQGAAAVLSIDLIIRIIKKIRNRAFLTDGANYYLLLLIMAITLLFTGAGLFAYDLPL